MIWRLTYCNKKGVEARIDIIRGIRTLVEVVQGSGNPFTMSYRLDKNDKSGHIMTSSADIEIFETETFNIDDLKTSNETELKVEYFENNILTWSGFILPDFFSREIGSPNIVRMTASDRLTALKGVTLSDLPAKVSLRSLIELSLAQTGLTLGLVSQIQISQGSTNILDSEILSQRLTDVRGRSISCYDILMSIMVGTNSTIRQRAGQWEVYNKLEHEQIAPTIFFDKVERGAIRTIQPVASSVGVYNEFGGGRSYPDNYDFSDGLTGWVAVNGFNASIDNRRIIDFSESGGLPPSTIIINPLYGESTERNYLVNANYGIGHSSAGKPYLRSSNIPVVYPNLSEMNVAVEINATSAPGPGLPRGQVNFAVIASNGVKTMHLNSGGTFSSFSGDPYIHKINFSGESAFAASTSSKVLKGLLQVEGENLADYNVNIRLYGQSQGVTGGVYITTSLIHSVEVRMTTLADVPKGNLYKTTQGSNFTKLHDVETVIFGDYIRKGLNGYFYDYPIDETSNLYLPSGTLSPPSWITVFDTTERPLLHHISRQKSTLFSIAHDILKANINVESFDPLAVFQDCKGGKYIVVSASFDFLRSEVDVELEQIAEDNTILKRDFIYSYFGEGEDTIKSIGGISGGGGAGGGSGMTSEQLEMLANLADWWKLDEENDAIYSEKSVYSLKGVSALGLGSSGGGGGGEGIDILDSWANYTEAKADFYAPASLLVPFRNDTLSRLASLESGGGGGTTVIWGATANNYSPLAVEGVMKVVALSGHAHTVSDVTGLQPVLDGKEPSFAKNTAFNKNFGTLAGTVMQGNDSRVHSHANKALLDLISQSNIDVLNLLSVVDGNIKVDTTLWATGGISTLGLGSNGGGGGTGGDFDRLDEWEDYNATKAGWVLSALLGKDLDTRVTNLSNTMPNIQVVNFLPTTPVEGIIYFVKE